MRRVGRLEHMGYVKRYQERLMASPEYEAAFEAAHRAYAAARLVAAGPVEVACPKSTDY